MSATVFIYLSWAATIGLTSATILRALQVAHPLSGREP
jgi:hypothetical protein